MLKDKNGIPATPSPPILFLLQQAQQEIFSLRQENANLKADVDNTTKAIDEIGNKLEKAYEDPNKSLIKNNEVFTEVSKMFAKI